MERNMADQPAAGSQRIQVKVLDAATGKEISSHETVVSPGGFPGFCSSTTSSTHNGPPQKM
jgi:hypothetical protein